MILSLVLTATTSDVARQPLRPLEIEDWVSRPATSKAGSPKQPVGLWVTAGTTAALTVGFGALAAYFARKEVSPTRIGVAVFPPIVGLVAVEKTEEERRREERRNDQIATGLAVCSGLAGTISILSFVTGVRKLRPEVTFLPSSSGASGGISLTGTF